MVASAALSTAHTTLPAIRQLLMSTLTLALLARQVVDPDPEAGLARQLLRLAVALLFRGALACSVFTRRSGTEATANNW